MQKVRVFAAIAAMTMLGCLVSNAQAASQVINLSATVPGYCTVGGSATPAAVSATVPVLADGFPNTSAITVTGIGQVACNENVILSLVSTNGGLTTAGSATGFSNRIDYSATATYAGGTGSTVTLPVTNGTAGASATGTTSTVGASATQALSVTVTPSTSANSLVIGNYADVLTLTFTPHT